MDDFYITLAPVPGSKRYKLNITRRYRDVVPVTGNLKQILTDEIDIDPEDNYAYELTWLIHVVGRIQAAVIDTYDDFLDERYRI